MEDWTVRLATPGDARGVLGLIRRCYGSTYPELTSLSPGRLARRLREGTMVYAIAQTPAGDHVGQVALERRGPTGLFEHGRAIVQPDYRCQGMMGAMSSVLLERFAPSCGVQFVVGRSVTNHLATQRYNKAAGFTPLGLLLGLWSPDLRVAGVPDPEQPISALLVGLRIEPRPRPRRLTLMGRNLERAQEVLEGLGVPFSRFPPARRAQPLGLLREVHLGGRLVQLRFGEELPVATPGVVSPQDLEGGGLTWADVPSEHPAANQLLDRLTELGFSHAAYLPQGGPAGEDVLRVQRYLDPRPLHLEAIQVLESSRPLRDEVFAESLAVLEAVA